MQEKPQSVTEFVSKIKQALEPRFQRIWIQGEISNYRPSASGHTYFNLSDRQSSLSMVLFRGDMMRNPEARNFRDGDQVVCYGDISVYGKRGTFQVVVKIIKAVGKGDLQAQFEKLKQKLASEGLFDIDRKRALPELPTKVALITSPTGAAVKDFLQVYSRRSMHMDVMLAPAVVQGDKAPESIRRALFFVLKYHMEKGPIDTIVITRGGGSMEDLWCFNDEGLAYDIFNSPVPIVSAIGHERDFTISDFVADKRCETPSAAAELLTQRQTEYKGKLLSVQRLLQNFSRTIGQKERQALSHLNPKLHLNKMTSQVESWQRRFDQIRLSSSLSLNEYEMQLDDCIERICQKIQNQMKEMDNSLDKNHSLLQVLGPKQVLSRGYSFIKSKENVVADYKSFNKLKAGSEIDIFFQDGQGEVVKK